ncbi:Phytosulfokine 3 precursor, putative isoform 2 [Hibiscus syriacus]|uniref:Phytosulfokine n=1 Tax=Hibiscus syriacus TaxID=106335 RepID=A0A6A3B3Q0_HIBSY|nr:putative phytosulfokines 6 [Hibiscus syriacus]KAE8711376.1 Phytosulfokine 3 precursor, putative isoform 2 [Hibiscus syriacus]
MKRSFLFTLLLILFIILVSSSQISARFSGNKQREEELELSQITDMEEIELMNQLMRMEACDDGDDGCLKRRIVSEARLDYIYTQHHRP